MVLLFLDLNGLWKFKGFLKNNGEEAGAQKPEFDDCDWNLGRVPGTVHTDLMANNLIPDPFKNLNESKVQWVAQSEWWYRKEFVANSDLVAKKVVELVFEGLDTFATVWLNGIKVGEANNMFTPWRFGIKEVLQDGSNVVVVRFRPAAQVALELERKFGGKYGNLHAENFSARPYVRKAQYSFGWDWGPTLPTAGIWQNVKVTAYDKARLGYLSTLPVQVSEKKALVKAVADVYVAEPCELKARFTLEGFEQRFEKDVHRLFSGYRGSIECVFEVDNPCLWWPNGYGATNLYDASVELFADEVLLDKATTKCGIRTVELLQKPDEAGKSFIFAINGMPVFCKGACWIPGDSFLPRVTAARLERLLGLAAEAGFNMIRVWGGGIYESDAFYDLCDKLGLLVWQDFMYACSAYPDDELFLAEAKREAEEAVSRLRGHPCIAVWCGNNEIQWQFTEAWKEMPRLFGLSIWNEILPDVVRRLDGTRPYRPTTPYADNAEPNSQSEGSRHNWDVWSKQVDYTAYLEDKGRFISEFGWQAPPKRELLAEYLGLDKLRLDSPELEAHEKQINGLKILQTLLALHYPLPQDFKQFTLYAQLNQAEALKTAVLHWRSRMYKTAGCLIWQLNDCWPVVSWSLIDYGLNPKPAYWAVKRACQPVVAPMLVKDDKVYTYVVNETNKSLELNLTFQILRFTGERLYIRNKKTAVPHYSSLQVFDEKLDSLPLAHDAVFAVTLKKDNSVVYEDSKTVEEPKNMQLPQPEIKIDFRQAAIGNIEVTLIASSYAKGVKLELFGLDCFFDDNFFDLLPNKEKKVTCKPKANLTLKEIAKAFRYQVYPYA